MGETTQQLQVLLGQAHGLPLEEIIGHLLAVQSARHTVQVPGFFAKIKQRQPSHRFSLHFRQ